jgi:VWFA-related protein
MAPRLWWMAGMLGLGALTLSAQEVPPALPGSTFGASVDVRVVNVEAVVTDARGERVRGLSAGDLKLEVDGQEVPIEYFAEVAGGQPVLAPSSASASAPSEGTPSPAPSLAPQGRSLLVFIDEAYAVANQRDAVLQSLERDLKLLGPEDRMAIVAFGSVTTGGRLDVLSGWTGDRAALAAALRAARKRPASGNDVLATRRSQANDVEILAQAQEASSDPYEEDSSGLRVLSAAVPADDVDPRLSSWLTKLSRAAVAAMHGMAPPSGRRTLLLLSGGWPTLRSHVSLALAANRLGYTVYPVDVQGIDSALAVNDASFATPHSNDGFISSGWERKSELGMELLARFTGGQAILNSARLTALGRVMEDTSSYYWLGFTPQWKGDDHQHRIKVTARTTVQALKGLKVRSRTGFSDFSRATEASLTTQGILLLGGDPKDKRLIVETGPPKAKGREIELPVTIVIPAADLTPIEQAGGWRFEATLGTAVVDGGSAFSNLAETPLRVTLPEKPGPGALIRHRMTLTLRRAKQRLVFTLRDPVGGGALWGEAEVAP